MAEQLSPERVRELAESGAAQVVDVRTDEEWDAGHLAVARHIQLDRLEAEAGSLDRDRPVILYCRGGDRSAMAADAFGGSGFDAHSMEGGIAAWAEHGLPLEPEDGEVTSPSGLPPR